jgi:hypothetical protein
MKVIFFFVLIVVCSSCNKHITFKDEIRPGEGSIYHKYVNNDLDFLISFFGGMTPILNPTYKEINTSMPKDYTYKLNYKKIRHIENIILNNATDKRGIHQLLQVYETKENFDLNIFYKEYRFNLNRQKNLAHIQDSFANFAIDSVIFKTIKYSKKTLNSHTSIVEYFCIQKKHLIRFIFMRKSNDSLDNGPINYEADAIISSFRRIEENRKANSIVNISQSFTDTKFNYIEPLIKAIENNQRGNNNELLATYYSFIGDYKNALEFKPKQIRKQENFLDTGYISNFNIMPATDVVKLIPDTCRVVMINEDHINPYSRIFMAKLLKPLFDKGFTCFASETLVPNYNDKSYTELKQGTGFYLSEPNYGNLLRLAFDIGYKIYSYEKDLLFDTKYGIKESEFRDFIQAKNIKKILESNPKAKIIVFAGHGHILKKNSNGTKLMAQFFSELTNINPFCVEQTGMTEASDIKYENVYYSFIEDKFKFDESIILKSKDSLFVVPRLKGIVDVQVFHPRTIYDSNNYAKWLLKKGEIRQKFSFKDNKFKGTIFQIFDTEEYENRTSKDAIPVINLPLNGDNEIEIYLKPQKYTVLVFDRYRNLLFNQRISLN